MKYPNTLQKNGIIGVCAPSAGFTEDKYIQMCTTAKKRLEKLGYKVVYSASCFKDLNGRSNTKKVRAKEFLKMYNDKEINIIISLSGGEYEMEILDFLNLNKLDGNKLFCGCSDNSILTFLLTTYCDVASIYGHNFYELGINHKVIENYISFLSGKKERQYEITNVEEKDTAWKEEKPRYHYNDSFFNEWKLYAKKSVDITGMMIGGLLDDLICVCGTKYDRVSEFLEKYGNEGFIWYFDVCTLTPEEVKRAFWQLRNAGWFKYAKLIMIGRPIDQKDSYGVDYRENIYDELKTLEIPIVLDINVGHIPPSYCFYNGALARVVFSDKERFIEYL